MLQKSEQGVYLKAKTCGINFSKNFRIDTFNEKVSPQSFESGSNRAEA
jgi:hypothetical protein